MSTDQNKSTVRRLIEEVFNKGNFSVITQFVDSKYVNHDPSLPEEVKGPEGLKQFVTSLRTSFPDLHMNVEDTFSEGDKVCCRWSCTGTHRSSWGSIPASGKKVKVSGIDLYRFSGDKILENWSQWDALGFMQQVGAIPELETSYSH